MCSPFPTMAIIAQVYTAVNIQNRQIYCRKYVQVTILTFYTDGSIIKTQQGENETHSPSRRLNAKGTHAVHPKTKQSRGNAFSK